MLCKGKCDYSEELIPSKNIQKMFLTSNRMKESMILHTAASYN
jgi:hypothetical protein